jgi:hypothetical protein
VNLAGQRPKGSSTTGEPRIPRLRFSDYIREKRLRPGVRAWRRLGDFSPSLRAREAFQRAQRERSSDLFVMTSKEVAYPTPGTAKPPQSDRIAVIRLWGFSCAV